jgi:hypothetical protein
MSKTIEGVYEGKEVRVTYDGEGDPCHLYVRYVEPINLVRQDDYFPNLRSLSAQLRGELGFRDACHLLYTNDVDPKSGLWALNHDGRPSEEYLKREFGDRSVSGEQK